jgi:hypothetical protein
VNIAHRLQRVSWCNQDSKPAAVLIGKLTTKALGGDQFAAWGAAHSLNKEHPGLRPDQPVVGTIGWLTQRSIDSETFEAPGASSPTRTHGHP